MKGMPVTLTYHGESHCISEWARRLGVCRQTLWSRYNLGWKTERLLTTPVPAPRPVRPKPEIAPSIFAPHIPGPAILIGGQWVPAHVWLESMEGRPRGTDTPQTVSKQ